MDWTPGRAIRGVVGGAVVVLGAGVFAWLALGPGEPPTALRSALPPNLARVECRRDGPRVLTPVIRPRPDGIHLAVGNPGGAKAFELHHVGWGEWSAVGGSIHRTRPTGSAGWSVPPGRVEIGCLAHRDDSYRDGPTGVLTVVDPEHLWHPSKLECGGHAVNRDLTGRLGPPGETTQEAVRRLVPDVHPTDVLRYPAYPDTPWMLGDTLHVVRDGREIASIAGLKGEHRWGISVYACPGYGFLK